MFVSSSLFLPIVGIIALILWLNRFHLRLHIIKSVKDVPGKPLWYLVINLLIFYGSPEDIWITFREMFGRHRKIFKIWFFNRLAICLKSPEELEVM